MHIPSTIAYTKLPYIIIANDGSGGASGFTIASSVQNPDFESQELFESGLFVLLAMQL
jgi:hypothetical protein